MSVAEAIRSADEAERRKAADWLLDLASVIERGEAEAWRIAIQVGSPDPVAGHKPYRVMIEWTDTRPATGDEL
jgi:hypothetical protein